MLISLAEYAKQVGKAERSVRQMAERGGFQTARKIGRNWIIDDAEPYPADRRRKATQDEKICIKCGAEFEAYRPNAGKTLCDDCAAKSANHTALRDRVCVDCGVHFVGYPRSMRCPDCNAVRKARLAKEYAERRKAGATRKIGSVDYCQNCGKAYIVAGGLQRYCPECAAVVVPEHQREQARKWARGHTDNAQRRKDRTASAAEIPCVVCGKMFRPGKRTKTCSPECADILQKSQRQEYVQGHKLADMTEEERAEYRERSIARARANYRERKEQKNK